MEKAWLLSSLELPWPGLSAPYNPLQRAGETDPHQLSNSQHETLTRSLSSSCPCPQPRHSGGGIKVSQNFVIYTIIITTTLTTMMIILLPRSIRPHRGALARRGSGGGRAVRAKLSKSKKRGKSSKRGRSRRGRNGKRGGRQDELADADVVTDDAAADPAAAGEGGEVGCSSYYGRKVKLGFLTLGSDCFNVYLIDIGQGM